MAHAELTAAQIGEALDANVLRRDAILSNEHRSRPVRRAGAWSGLHVDEVLNNGNMMRTPLRFPVISGQGLNGFVRNQDASPLTSGTLVEMVGTLFLRWM